MSGGVRSEGFEVGGNLLPREVSTVGKSVSLCTVFRNKSHCRCILSNRAQQVLPARSLWNPGIL